MTGVQERLRTALGARYTIGEELGRGGMAVVFAARDLKHQRDVAIKILHAELGSSVGSERFLREIRIAAQLQHPNIVPLYDSGDASGLLYYVMPLIDGESLQQRIANEGQLPIADALRLTHEIADALAYAHNRGVVHRDIKPANLLLSGGHAMIADFGIARAVEVVTEGLTGPGMAIGTTAYMSPEQAMADPRVDGRSDVYSLACVLYEMLAGEPPFTGNTTHVILARKLHQPPPSLRDIRSTVPHEVDALVTRTLSKVAADRPAAAEFAAIVDRAASGAMAAIQPRVRTMGRPLVAGIGVALLALAGWGVKAWRTPALDPNRVVVFPINAPDDAIGENAARLIGYALEGTGPLQWLDGVYPGEGPPEERRTPDRMRSMTRSKDARYFIHGTTFPRGDSTVVRLELYDASRRAIPIARESATGAAGMVGIPELSVRAVRGLLVKLLEPGRRIDISPLADRPPAAIANFLQGEREYRSAHFARALERYRAAVDQDSMFALAALKGATTASWLLRTDEAQQLTDIAMRQPDLLPPRHLEMARGLRFYLAGTADSAVTAFERAIRHDSSFADAWMALGEAEYHLIPAGRRDTLAEESFRKARRVDPEFSPPLYHLAEFALRAGEIARADSLARELARVNPDTTIRVRLDLIVRCVRYGLSSVDWARAAATAPDEIVTAGKSLIGGNGSGACARGAFRAVLASQRATAADRWGALLGLHGLLIATQREADAVRLVASRSAVGLPGHILTVLAGAAGARVDSAALEDGVRAIGTDYESLSSTNLWALAEWAASRGDAERLRLIGAAIRENRDSTGTRRDSLLWRIVDAHVALAQRDTAGAIVRLTALVPDATHAELEWQPWEALAAERMTLARIAHAQGRHRDAIRLAGEMDNPYPISHLMHLRPSLELRAAAADAMGDSRRAGDYRLSLARLVADSIPVP